jgi:hypothetical protein
MQTLNQIKKKLKELQESHLQLNDFFFGSFHRIGASASVTYPLFAADLLPSGISRRVDTTKMIFVFAGKVKRDVSNELEVKSDMKLAALDIFAQFYDWCEQNGIELSPDATLNDFDEAWDDDVAGYEMEISFNQFYERNACQTPGQELYLALENGDLLLLENDDKLLL